MLDAFSLFDTLEDNFMPLFPRSSSKTHKKGKKTEQMSRIDMFDGENG